MSKLPKVFNILTIISSVIGFGFVLHFAINKGSLIGTLFGLSIAVIPFCISRSISELNHLSNLKFSHLDAEGIDSEILKE